MLRDITLGQYYPTDSVLHRMDPRTKLFGTMAYIVSLFIADSLPVYAAAALFLVAYLLYAEVLRENTWLSRTVRVQEGQQLVDTGLYGVIRHPMYAATILLCLSMPLVLGSWVACAFFLPYPLLIAKRIKNEEHLLEEQLNGYADYKDRVKYRLVPYIW